MIYTDDGYSIDTTSHCIYCGTKRTIQNSDFCGYECYHKQQLGKCITYIKLCINCALYNTIKCGVNNPTTICNLFIPEKNCPNRRNRTHMYDPCSFGSTTICGGGFGYGNYHYYLDDEPDNYGGGFPRINSERLGYYEKDLLPEITEKSINTLLNEDVFEPIKPLKRRLSVKILLSMISLIKWICKV